MLNTGQLIVACEHIGIWSRRVIPQVGDVQCCNKDYSLRYNVNYHYIRLQLSKF